MMPLRPWIVRANLGSTLATGGGEGPELKSFRASLITFPADLDFHRD